MRTILLLALSSGTLLLPVVCAAQGHSGNSAYALNGPSLGLIFDPASVSIRPVLGIPGAASIGAPLEPGFPVWRAAVAPGGDFALAVARGNFRLAIIRADGGVQQLESTLGEAPELIAFSPRGSSAALYYADSGRLLVIAGLRDQAQRALLADTSSLGVAPRLVAVSEDGASVLVAVPEGEAAGLYYLPVNQPAAPIRKPRDSATGTREDDSAASVAAGRGFAQASRGFQSISAVRFDAASDSDALVADQETNSVYLIHNVSGASRISVLGSEPDGLSKPVAIDAMDSLRVLVANAGTGKLTMLHRDGSQAESVACGCSPTMLHPLTGKLRYRLTELSEQPMWLLDAGGKESRVLAIPPLHAPDAAAARGAQR